MLRRHTVLEGGRVVFGGCGLVRAAVLRGSNDDFKRFVDPFLSVAFESGEVFNAWVAANDPAIPLTWRNRASRMGPMFARSSSESYRSSLEG